MIRPRSAGAETAPGGSLSRLDGPGGRGSGGATAEPAKLATDVRLRGEVQGRLELRHSPEQVMRRLREDFPDDPEMWVSHETIYQSLFVQSRGLLRRELTTCLRTGRALRRPRRQAAGVRAARGRRIPDMVNICERPAEAADRAVPGHWEGDLIIGQDSGSAIGTLVERATRFVLLLHLPPRPDGQPDHGAVAVQAAMVAKMSQLPEQLLRTLTWDQGIEMTNHARIAEATGLDIYFCDPHSPWQRGSNEFASVHNDPNLVPATTALVPDERDEPLACTWRRTSAGLACTVQTDL